MTDPDRKIRWDDPRDLYVIEKPELAPHIEEAISMAAAVREFMTELRKYDDLAENSARFDQHYQGLAYTFLNGLLEARKEALGYVQGDQGDESEGEEAGVSEGEEQGDE